MGKTPVPVTPVDHSCVNAAQVAHGMFMVVVAILVINYHFQGILLVLSAGDIVVDRLMVYIPTSSITKTG